MTRRTYGSPVKSQSGPVESSTVSPVQAYLILTLPQQPQQQKQQQQQQQKNLILLLDDGVDFFDDGVDFLVGVFEAVEENLDEQML